ncbi:glycosyltransferase [Sphaerochaeta sp. PS]|uniref:glycosyltransferase n=1 Tax=Sphaerochaeta sp. PS TaxID=3076336 RepID=UPI0028A360B6|nr:glycosyltransferase [Sphaerochaeta sp. PS]MDT4762157.1 glycosyltransferase [Sphaerochaeta sp. PS]
MRKLCIMITHKFPYNQDESFIENEITYLANAFDTIVILAAYATEKDVQTRSLPSNVVVHRLGYSSLGIWRKVGLSFKGMLNADKLIWNEVHKKPEIGWKANCLYMYGTVLALVARATSQLHKSIDISSFDNCVVYSYWFLEHAFIANRLAAQYKNQILMYIVSRAHRYDVYANRRKYRAFPFRDLVLSHIDAVIPCSQDGTNHLTQTHPLYADKFHTAYLGTTDYGINIQKESDKFILVSCSNIVEVKRVHLIAEALLLLVNQGFDNFLWICIGDGTLLSRLMAQVSENLSLNAHIEFMGRISNSQVLDFYKQKHVDLFVNVSESEGLPVSIMEAQSFGIPCYATDVGGTSEIVNNTVGRLLPENLDAIQLAEYLKEFMSLNVEVQEEYRHRARMNWLERFDAQKNFQDWAIQLADYFK